MYRNHSSLCIIGQNATRQHVVENTIPSWRNIFMTTRFTSIKHSISKVLPTQIRSIMNSNVPKYPRLLVIEKNLEWPMLILSFLWLCILIAELVNVTIPLLSGFGTGIWILFIFYFAMRLAAVENRIAFLKKNWLFILAILV